MYRKTRTHASPFVNLTTTEERETTTAERARETANVSLARSGSRFVRLFARTDDFFTCMHAAGFLFSIFQNIIQKSVTNHNTVVA